MNETWVYAFPAPDKVITLNSRMHHMDRASTVKSWRWSAWANAVNAISKGRLKKGSPPCLVQVRFPVRSLNIRRDPHNYIATVKPIVDGLVDARIWPDDTPDWVTVVDPVFHTGSLVVVELRRS
jgi:hypothetical protein